MATLKHINSKNADYGAAEQYLLFEHDEFTMKPVLDETGRLIPREDYRLSTLNCGGEDFAVACMRANLRYEKNQRREDVKSHHYIISFDPRDGPDNGLTVDRAQALGEKFCAEHFPGHQALVCTHPDGHNHSGNIHVHIVINSLRIEEVPFLPYMDRPADTKAGCKHRCTDAALRYLKLKENYFDEDATTANPTSFDGAYFATTPEASAFETLLARLMDGMATYEAEKYGQQRLLAFINDPLNDPFAYETFYARQLGKYSRIDAEHIRPTEAFASGYFAAYSVSASFPDFSQYLSAGQRSALGEALAELDTERFGDGYVQLLNAYHTMPVLVASYGFSTARGTVSTEGPLNEQEQGERLVAAYEDFLSAGCAGAVVSTWQDVWTRRTWNTSYAVDVYESHRWHDLQSAGQSSGLLAFAPGSEASACVVDGDGSEWTEADVVWQANGLSLSVRQDAEGLYLLVRGEGVSPQAALYIPIDVTPLSGATQSAQPSLRFARGADFLLCLSGAENSRLLVQARYEALRENYLASTSGEDPFADPPAADSSLFVPIGMVTERTGVLTEEEAAQAEGAPLLPVYETGRLRQGTLDPADAAYDSLADFCYGDGLVEVRLPWQLLNFYSPAGAQVHADYYQHYGVEPLRIESIYLGVGLGETAEEISMSAYKLETWQQPTYRERLKAAYWMLQESWGGGDAD